MFTIKKLISGFSISISLLLMASTTTMASPITSLLSNDDITEIQAFTPEGWTAHNLDMLFDGETSRYTKKRYAGYQNDGDLLSDTNSFTISVLLNQDVNLASISFFNDWRHILGQQVNALSIDLIDSNEQILWSDTFTNLMLYTWDKIDLVEFEAPVLNVRQIDFSITNSQGNHFEIRELLVETVNMPELAQVSVHAPASLALVLLSALSIVGWRVKNKV